MLALQGRAYSAKTSTARFLRRVMDPAKELEVRKTPKSTDDLIIAAQGTHILAFDNITRISADLSDDFCVVSTGGGLGKRKLYADGQEVLFHAKAPQNLTGIQEFVTRGDLVSRAIVLHLPPLTAPRTEAELEQAWAPAHPRILGALLDRVAVALAHREPQAIPAEIRMRDFAAWVLAAAGGDEFLDAYGASIQVARTVEVDASPLAQVLLAFMAAQPGRAWAGTAGKLLTAVTAFQRAHVLEPGRWWPTSPKALSDVVRSHELALAEQGLVVERHRDKTQRTLKLTLKAP